MNRTDRLTSRTSPGLVPHPDDPVCTWETACRCGAQYCRSGWPAGAPSPADLPDPLPFLRKRLAAGGRAR